MIKNCTNDTPVTIDKPADPKADRDQKKAVWQGSCQQKADIKPVNGLCDKLPVLSYSNNCRALPGFTQ